MARPKNCGRCNKVKTVCKCGRPSVMTPEVIAKLEQAYAMDMTDSEACLYAGIAKSPLYNYQKANPEFKERKELLKSKLSLKAKSVMANSINNGDKEAVKWWLERRRKNEFSLKTENKVEVTQVPQIIDDLERDD